MAKVKEKMVKAAREKESRLQENTRKTINWFLCRKFVCQKTMA